MRAVLLLCGAVLVATPVLASDPPAATAQVCTGVKDRTPQGTAERFPATVGELYCFSRLTNVSEKVLHVWFQGDREILRIELPVKAAQWRTWSAKKISPGMTGPWRVEVRDAAGTVLATAGFTVE
ncbi:MAG TPA: DUF2914 domain-containing protein [Thermoanaerobaculaceae bacterium]|nr:DUF2914 domain-containing protein [Thermoanaerobaculaceae bacterium]